MASCAGTPPFAVARRSHADYPACMDSRLPDIARATSDAHEMMPSGTAVLAMVSGGADSISLLRLLASGALGEMDLSVLHVNHMLRGEAADEDAGFVSSVCADLHVPCRVVRYDVSAYAQAQGLNLEDAGRRVRYRFAEEELEARCASPDDDRPRPGRIAVAHTYDDRMETFLMRLATGAGPGGLTAIPYVRGRIVRPLLDARRSDVVAYLEELGQSWREDSTNGDTTRLRARVRAELLPWLEGVNPRFGEALFRTLAVLGDEEELLDEMADAFAGDFVGSLRGEVRFDRSRMMTLSRPMARRVVRTALMRVFPEASRIEFAHVEALADGMAADGFSRDLPDGLRAFSEYGTLVVTRAVGETGSMEPSLLEIPGELDLGSAGRLTAEYSADQTADDDPATAVIDADRVSGPLTVDSVRPGDRIRPLGMRGTRKLQDVLTDAKVPRRMRSQIPVVRDGESIVWVAGTRMSEDYRVGRATTRTVRLAWTGPRNRED